MISVVNVCVAHWKTHLLSLSIVLVANHALGERGYLCKRHDFVLCGGKGCRGVLRSRSEVLVV